jgi:hypothetical protein
MANSTTNIDGIVSSQSAKEVTANAFFDAASPAATYGRRASTSSGLTWGYYGGNVFKTDGTLAQIANGTLTLTASSTNYIVAAKATGAVSVSTAATNWNNQTDYWRLYSVVTGASSVTSYTDARAPGKYGGGDAAVTEAAALKVSTQSGASYTLAIGDAAGYLRMDNAGANTVTVPPNSSVAFPVGTTIHIRQAGSGQTTVAAGSGVTITSPETLKLRKQHSAATVVKVATDAWEMMGDLEVLP